MIAYHVIKRPVITEKTREQAELGQFVFAVDPRATKDDIRRAVEKLFEVNVRSVNTMVVGGKRRRTIYGIAKRSNWKKAIVTLQEGQSISYFEDDGFDFADGAEI